MRKSNCQKIKLLKLLEILQQETDENHPIGTPAICERLNQIGISCDRRTMYKDIECLNAQGFDVRTKRVGTQNAYYAVDRRFNLEELKILIDAVQAANFITESKTKELVDKIAGLGGSHYAEVLRSSVTNFNTKKHTNEEIYDTVSAVENACLQKRLISFWYFDLDDRKNRIYRHEKERYLVDPMTLILSEDNYYLLGYSRSHKSMRNYRLDRMEGVRMEDEEICDEAKLTFSVVNVEKYKDTVFAMYGGESAEVALAFENELIGAVYDRFGENTPMTRVNDTLVTASVRVQVSPTFFGWVAQFAGKMRILAPNEVIEKYMDHMWNTMYDRPRQAQGGGGTK